MTLDTFSDTCGEPRDILYSWVYAMVGLFVLITNVGGILNEMFLLGTGPSNFCITNVLVLAKSDSVMICPLLDKRFNSASMWTTTFMSQLLVDMLLKRLMRSGFVIILRYSPGWVQVHGCTVLTSVLSLSYFHPGKVPREQVHLAHMLGALALAIWPQVCRLQRIHFLVLF